MKKLVSILLFLILISTLSSSVFAAGFTPPFDITAKSAYMLNVDTGLVLYEKNADDKLSIASLTKLMTILLLMEKVPAEELDSTLITADPSLFTGVILGNAGANIWPREEITARTLLYTMIIPSANESAEIAGFYLGNGNMQNFYAMMNARAKQLGCKNTNYSNAHGLLGIDTGNYSSARDVALVFAECWKYDVFREAAQMPSFTRPATNRAANHDTVHTTNKMLSKTSGVYREYVKGGKTGSTPEAGRNFASISTKDGYTYLTVVLGTPWDPADSGYAYSFHDTINLCDWAFKDFSVRPALDTTTPINEITVNYSRETDVLKLFPAEEMKTILPNGSDETVLQKKFELPQSVDAPIKQGDIVGKVTLALAGEVIGTVDLIAGQDISRDPVLFMIAKFTDFITSLYFRVVLIVSGIALTGYVIFAAMHNKKTQKSRKVKRPKL